jgi:UDP:flavonoid glycosyltransferase YjiC (YdhE family)
MSIIPQGAGDNLHTGWRCATVGAGVLVEDNPPQPEAIRTAVTTILEQPNYRASAQRFQREIKELPSLTEAVRRLEILAEDRSPQFCDHHLDLRSSSQAYPVETHTDTG